VRDGRFKVRALTRDVNGARAQAFLKEHASAIKSGDVNSCIELAKGDLSDAKSIRDATVGAFGLFINITKFFETFKEDDEVEQGKNAIDAAVANNVQHVVLSTEPGPRTITHGRIRAPHYDGKWRVAMLLRASSLRSWSLIFAPGYFENFLGMSAPQPVAGKTNEYTLSTPFGGKRVPYGSIADFGGVVLPLFANPTAYNGKVVDAWTEFVSLPQIGEEYSKATGRVVHVNDMSSEAFAKLPLPHGVAKLVADMFQFYQEQDDRRRAVSAAGAVKYEDVNTFHELGLRDADVIHGMRALYPAAVNFATFMRAAAPTVATAPPTAPAY